ncbi:hypothetical protein ACFL2Q_17410 [Thermodesulfobacteriota bacterium]
MRSIGYAVILALLTVACGAQVDSRTLVLKYSDFGPQIMAWETIGMEWWQWDNHGDSDPKATCEVMVVVYRDIPLPRVERMYPVVPRKEQDYRYVPYGDAIRYLNRNINEKRGLGITEDIVRLTERLNKTKAVILEKLGQPAGPLEGAQRTGYMEIYATRRFQTGTRKSLG